MEDLEIFNNMLNAEIEAALKGENLDKMESLAFKVGYLKQKLYYESQRI